MWRCQPYGLIQFSKSQAVIARSDLSAVAQRAKAEATKQSILPLCCEFAGRVEPAKPILSKLMVIAEFIIGRASARPVGPMLATLARKVPSWNSKTEVQ